MRQFTLILLLLALPPYGMAHAADRFVSTKGDDNGGANDCLVVVTPCRTIAQALSQMASGDAVKIAGGKYKENLSITTSGTRTLSGGWGADFSAQNSKAPTTLTGGKNRALKIEAGTGVTNSTTLEKLKIANSTAANFDDAGGGLLAEATGAGCDIGADEFIP